MEGARSVCGDYFDRHWCCGAGACGAESVAINYWHYTHTMHPLHAGELDRRGCHGGRTVTVAEQPSSHFARAFWTLTAPGACMLSHSGVPGEIDPSRISGGGGVCFPVAISPNVSKSKRFWSINIVDDDECRLGAAWR